PVAERRRQELEPMPRPAIERPRQGTTVDPPRQPRPVDGGSLARPRTGQAQPRRARRTPRQVRPVVARAARLPGPSAAYTAGVSPRTRTAFRIPLRPRTPPGTLIWSRCLGHTPAAQFSLFLPLRESRAHRSARSVPWPATAQLSRALRAVPEETTGSFQREAASSPPSRVYETADPIVGDTQLSRSLQPPPTCLHGDD